MTRSLRFIATAGVACAAVACSDASTATQRSSVDLSAAFATAPPGFSATLNTFDATMDPGPMTWVPSRGLMAGLGQWSASGFMGGGLAAEFMGGDAFVLGISAIPFDNDADHDSDDDQCMYSAGTGVVTCGPVSRHGLTVTETIAYTDTAGHPQSSRNGATASVETKIAASGTLTRAGNDRDNDDEHADTTQVVFSSDRKVGGLAHGSTSRTVDATSAGTESTSGVADSVHFTSMRTIGDTTTGLVIPVQNGRPTYPTAGTVIRSMAVTVTKGAGAPATASRREVITYDGSNTAKVVITKNGVTQNCTLPLPHGRLSCS